MEILAVIGLKTNYYEAPDTIAHRGSQRPIGHVEVTYEVDGSVRAAYEIEWTNRRLRDHRFKISLRLVCVPGWLSSIHGPHDLHRVDVNS